ncbi:MAG: hypothetical protein HZA50_00115 [Planctomycetes bacterium]|nr:hypothetical protein [Planctomycetota bacterium]
MIARLFAIGWILSAMVFCAPSYGQNAQSAGRNVIAYKELEKQVLAELRKPVDQRDLAGLLAKLRSADMPAESSMAVQVRDWIDAIEQAGKADSQTRQMINQIDQTVERQKDYARRLAELQEQAKNPPGREGKAQGVLGESGMSSPSPAIPKRYELRDPKTGKAAARALNSNGKIDLEKYLDQQVKVVGPASFVRELGMDVIDVTSLTVVDGGKEKIKPVEDNYGSTGNTGGAVKPADGETSKVNTPVVPPDRTADVRRPVDQQTGGQKPAERTADNDSGRKPLETADIPVQVADNSRQGRTPTDNPPGGKTVSDKIQTDQTTVQPAKHQGTVKPPDKAETIVSPIDRPTRLEDLGGGPTKVDNPAGANDRPNLTSGNTTGLSAGNTSGKPPADLKSPANEIEYD